MTSVATRMTADEFELVDDNGLELIDGEIREREMSLDSSRTAARLIGYLFAFVRETGTAEVFTSELGYRMWPAHPGRVRKPDVSIILSERMPAATTSGFSTVAPDIAVEVVSPGDSAGYLDAKLLEYAEAGVPATWVIFPENRIARIYRGFSEVAVLFEDDFLDGEDILPGFRLRLGDVLPQVTPLA